jgi:hypothetical protein
VVLLGAPVAEFEAAAAAAGDLGDHAFHVGSVLPVLLPQFGFRGPVGAGPAEQSIAFVEIEGAAG